MAHVSSQQQPADKLFAEAEAETRAENAVASAAAATTAAAAVVEYDVDRIEQVYRKLDLRIIPAFWVQYFLCSAIRSNIGLAQTMNAGAGHDLTTVLRLTPQDVSTALALFYVAYVLFDCPSNLVMTRLSPRVWMARIVFAVGIIGVCFTAVKDAWSLK